ncbi:PPP family 3-phenylpropionic acid transporter [Natronocella acetinitrilica]|uniref:PPP family 3-phenylpropionic acid transporter n=1 Tax=Natronocella acetinitrilica TaxID=414046 RepID=A0AAE3G1J4_9GAMM|nr:PPP family 3-phenylpropionic acid transporter [Natronocella acetinitrilica]
MQPALPYWRLSAFYFFFFAVLGVLAPYWGPYLDAQGYSAAQIGQLIAILHATKIIAPNIWGWIADVTGKRMAIVRMGALFALFSFAGVLLGEGFWWLALVMAAFSFFWNAALPQFEANTMNHLGAAAPRYSRIRLWGSIGFIVTVLLFGELIDRFGIDMLPAAMLLLFAGLWVSAQIAPQAPMRVSARQTEPIVRVFFRPAVVGFFLACFLLQASHGPYFAFFSIHLAGHGYGSSAIGGLWALGVIAEIVLFFFMHRLLPAVGARVLMTVALALSALRWVLIGALADVLPLLLFAQLLHAASFGVYHAVGISMVNHYFIGRNQGRGQALYSSITFGAGVAVGSLVAGLLWDEIGGTWVFHLAAVMAAVAAVIAWFSLPADNAAGERGNNSSES